VRYQPPIPTDSTAIICWNPFAAEELIRRAEHRGRAFVVDLLDDWSGHYAFSSVREEVVKAYSTAFAHADSVIANSKGTLQLANRLGRDDAELVPNGCDPDRFALPPQYGDSFTIGYGGKIGERVDFELIRNIADLFPPVTFEFAGPASRRDQTRLRRSANVRLLGDVPYSQYPKVVSTWDAAWVPHLVSEGGVGGDVIKIYEYRAAGLLTITTPIVSAERAPDGVIVAHAEETADAVNTVIRGSIDGHLPRVPYEVPEDQTWEFKAQLVIERLGMDAPSG
jgi:glycosyltransferase involved in cell wall biosynthesis